MPSTAEKLLVRFREQDGPLGVTRDTLRKLASSLGVDETAAIHLSLVQLADKVLPRYERDAGLLTAAQLREARSLVTQERKPTSSLFGTTGRQQARKKTKAKA
jgi:hypothetical protein